MTFEIELGGRSRQRRRSSRAGGHALPRHDRRRGARGRRACGSDESGLSLLFLTGDAGVSRYAEVVAGPAGESLVWLDGAVGRRSWSTAAAPAAARSTPRRTAHGEQAIVAPMPGRVVRVLVAPGDEVAARQPVVVVEAMKMENELRSPKAGRVKDVPVTEGTSVEAGRVLVVIE